MALSALHVKLKRMTDREYYWNTVKVLIRLTPAQKEDVSGAALVTIAILCLAVSIAFFGWISH